VRRLAPALVQLFLAAAPAGLLGQTVGQADSAARAAKAAQSLPLITTRTLRFTTDEGTWLSVDVSPDGRTIVFDLLGDLYTLPIEGGRATRITSGPGFDAQPRYSPDGKRILFVSDRSGADNLWVVQADGSGPRPLTAGKNQKFRSPVWLDADHVIADRENDLWLYHTSQKEGLRLTNLESPRGAAQTGTWFLGPALGPDRRYLWVNRASSSAAAGAAPGEQPAAEEPVWRNSARGTDVYQIARIDRETGYISIRTHEIEGAYRPMPSPDGRWLVYATRHDGRTALKLRDLRTGTEQWLRMDVQADASRSWATLDVYPGSAFTPDSRALITSSGGKIRRIEIPSGAETVIPFEAEVEQALGPLAKFEYPIDDSLLTVRQVRGARLSPDGKRVVFAALDRLWIADLPPASAEPLGGAPEVIRTARRLTAAEVVEHGPAWSPDGRWIAYVTWSDREGGQLYRVRADGRDAPQRLTTVPAYYDKVAWSPDGTRLVAVRGSNLLRLRTLEDYGRMGRDAELELVWLPAQGGEPTRIVDLPGGASQEGYGEPHFGPEADRVYLTTDGVLASLKLDGTDRREVLKVTGGPGWNGAPATPDEIRLAPDGRHALALVQQNVYLIVMPPATGQTPAVSLVRPSFTPTRRLTRIGGEFVGWRADGRAASWSLGRSVFQLDLDRLSPGSDTGAARRGGDFTRRFDLEIVVPKDRPRGTIVLTGGRLVTMKGDEIIEKGDLVVTDNRITAIGPTGQVAVPAGARVVDVGGATVIPGYVDIHTHSWVAWGLHRDQVSQYLAQLAYGVTSQRDPQTTTTDILSYADLVETGTLIGPRIESTGPGLHLGDAINSLEDARDVLRRYAEFYRTKTVKQYAVGDRETRQWFITAARELGLTPTTEGAGDVKKDLSLLLDGYAGLEHGMPTYPLSRDVVELLRFSGATFTPTLLVNYGGPRGLRYFLTRTDVHADPKLRYFTPHDELNKWRQGSFFRDDQYIYRDLARELTRIVRAGGRVALGAHGELQGLGAHWELWLMASGGLSNHEVLRIGTRQGAEAIGLGRDVGSLEVGKLADLQVLDQNPLDRIENTVAIRYVMKNGRLYDASTLDELWPRQRPLPAQWWWSLDPPGDAPAKAAGRGRTGSN
jgi:imidazolonepropionase-like amidohydrolase/Tol biopolymer transport system component